MGGLPHERPGSSATLRGMADQHGPRQGTCVEVRYLGSHARPRPGSHAGGAEARDDPRRPPARRVVRGVRGSDGEPGRSGAAKSRVRRARPCPLGLGSRGPRVTGSRHDWDFPYEPLAGPPCGDAPEPVDAVVATSRPVDRSALEGALGLPEVDLEMLLDRAPLHWVRVRSPAILTPEAMADRLIRAGIPLRYATPARHGSMAIAPRLETSRTMVARPDDWRSVRARAYVDAPAVGARWFIGDAGGVCIDRRLCGTGAGTHLAVIDDDVADLERLD